MGDDIRIQKVLFTLLKNALKFTDPGGEVRIKLDANRTNPEEVRLFFTVEDTGIGIAAEKQKSLFQPFTQADTSMTRKYEGTGLGLAISRNLVNLMKGKIRVKSTVDEGSTFIFEIPATRVDSNPANAVQLPSISSLKKTLSSMKEAAHENEELSLSVLLVEDNPVNQKVASMSLERLGCTVEIASNGKEAVEIASGNMRFDLICMDLQMPVMDGLEAMRRIREQNYPNSETFTLALTGLAFDEDKERCRVAGINDFLTKPLDLESLGELVECIHLRKCHELALSN